MRERDRGHALAGSSTLNRLELGEPKTAQCHRYKKIVADGRMIDTLLVELFLDSERRPPAQVVLDLDATDDAVHGNQEGRFFHGYYGHYCYLPLYITCGEHMLCCRLRRADADAADGAVDELAPIVAQIRQRWPDTKILLRGNSGFCREEIMAWCERQGVDFVLGLARDARLQKRIAKAPRKSRRRCAATGKASRRFREFRYRTLDSWSRHRQVVAKAEWPAGARGGNPRFVVTSLDRLPPNPLCSPLRGGSRCSEARKLMIEERFSIGLPAPWPGGTFEAELVGPINYLVGPNGSGKSRFAAALLGHFRNRSLRARLLGTDRLREMANPGTIGGYFGDHFATGYAKSAFPRLRSAGEEGSGVDTVHAFVR